MYVTIYFDKAQIIPDDGYHKGIESGLIYSEQEAMMTDIVPYLEQLRARFAQPEMQATFRGFKKTMQFTFPDLRRDFTLSIAEDGSATLAEQTIPHPDVKVTTSSDTLAGILDRTINPIQAYITRKLKVSGQMDDLLRLQKLL